MPTTYIKLLIIPSLREKYVWKTTRWLQQKVKNYSYDKTLATSTPRIIGAFLTGFFDKLVIES